MNVGTLSITAPRMDDKEYRDEINNLSPEEKDKAERDLYGKERKLPEETEDFLSQKFSEFRIEIDRHCNKAAYSLAVQRCPEYVQDKGFELLFLRADFFDVTKAVTRMVLYWKSKLKIFGEEKTFRKITLADLKDDDLASLRAGSYMALPNRDAAGRAVMYASGQEFVYKERQNMVRLLWYMVHAMLEDETVQQKGFIAVVFEKGFSFSRYDRKLDKMLLDHSSNIWPVRFAGFHCCFDSKLNEIIMPFALVMMGKEMRARFRLHPGSRLDSRFEELADYGILKQDLPNAMGGTLEFDPEEWLESRRQQGL